MNAINVCSPCSLTTVLYISELISCLFLRETSCGSKGIFLASLVSSGPSLQCLLDLRCNNWFFFYYSHLLRRLSQKHMWRFISIKVYQNQRQPNLWVNFRIIFFIPWQEPCSWHNPVNQRANIVNLSLFKMPTLVRGRVEGVRRQCNYYWAICSFFFYLCW